MGIITVNKCELAFLIEFRRCKGMRVPNSSEEFPVLCSKDTVILLLHEAAVHVLMRYKSRGDSWLRTTHISNNTALLYPIDGGWVSEGPLSDDMKSSTVLFTIITNRFF